MGYHRYELYSWYQNLKMTGNILKKWSVYFFAFEIKLNEKYSIKTLPNEDTMQEFYNGGLCYYLFYTFLYNFYYIYFIFYIFQNLCQMWRGNLYNGKFLITISEISNSWGGKRWILKHSNKFIWDLFSVRIVMLFF